MLKKKESVINYLELIPIRNKESKSENGKVVILIPKFKNAFLKSLIPKKKSENFSVNLDELGSDVWNLIDGVNNVEYIINCLSEKLGEKIHPAQERITKFLSQLYASKFILFNKLNK
jgi:hypothetical protein